MTIFFVIGSADWTQIKTIPFIEGRPTQPK
jgi:hypothetical protein